MLWFLLEAYRMSTAIAALCPASDQSNASVDDIEIYWCCGYTPYLSVFPVITRAQYRCRSEIPITACVSVINNRRRLLGRSQGGNGGSASMFNTRSAIHTSRMFTWASEISWGAGKRGGTEYSIHARVNVKRKRILVSTPGVIYAGALRLLSPRWFGECVQSQWKRTVDFI